jgi:signal transduction histidine kinase
MRIFPRTLAGRTLLVLLAGLAVSHVIALGIYAGERHLALTTQSGRSVADRIAAVISAFDEAEPGARRDLVRTLWLPGFRVVLTAQSMITEQDRSWRAGLIRAAISRAVGSIATERIRIAEHDAARLSAGPWSLAEPPDGPWRGGGGHLRHLRDMRMAMPPGAPMQQMARAWRSGRILEASLQLSDGNWLNFAVLTARPEPLWSSRLMLSNAVMAVAVIALSIWAVRRATKPLAAFSKAAERLGADVSAPPVAEDGPSEVNQLARAFNGMQRRLRVFVQDRTQILAAISHDLRTPITRLRLRADFVEDEDQRRKMLADLDQMETMIAATLSFARDDANEEPRKAFDLAVLLQDTCDALADAGARAVYTGAPAVTYRGRPVALKRVFANLVDNAVKYGGAADVTLSGSDGRLTVTIDDDGPGIPEEQMEKVFAPFYRLEGSRSRDTGGVGLGLAAVRSIVRAQGGAVRLANRDGGGLRVTVELPAV